MAIVYYPKGNLIARRDTISSSFETIVLASSPNAIIYFDSASSINSSSVEPMMITSSWAISSSWAPAVGGVISGESYNISASWASSSLSSSFLRGPHTGSTFGTASWATRATTATSATSATTATTANAANALNNNSNIAISSYGLSKFGYVSTTLNNSTFTNINLVDSPGQPCAAFVKMYIFGTWDQTGGNVQTLSYYGEFLIYIGNGGSAPHPGVIIREVNVNPINTGIQSQIVDSGTGAAWMQVGFKLIGSNAPASLITEVRYEITQWIGVIA